MIIREDDSLDRWISDEKLTFNTLTGLFTATIISRASRIIKTMSMSMSMSMLTSMITTMTTTIMMTTITTTTQEIQLHLCLY